MFRWDGGPPPDRLGFVAESYADLLPEPLRAALLDALGTGQFDAAANQLRPRLSYGNSRRVLIGDAAGHYHPMTAVGMTLGFGDALALAEGRGFHEFVAGRFRATSSPEFLAMSLYEVFTDHRTEAVALRQAIYRGWRAHSAYRDRTTRILACEDRSAVQLGLAFFSTTARAIARGIPQSRRALASRQSRDIFLALAVRFWWLLRGVLLLYKTKSASREQEERVHDTLARALLSSMSPEAVGRRAVRAEAIDSPNAGPVLKNATARLLDLQRKNGAWEGEMVWCPMLTAQYVLLHHIIGQPLEPGRRRRVLRSFERTRLEGGVWGLHEHSPPHLFVTALVYVAARLLGVGRDDPLVAPARCFIRAEGILGIPSWGKFWLALLNLYDWRGVNAILPELWSLPRRIPLHPSNWYCHTRLIYMAMAAIYPHRHQVPVTPSIAELREELYTDDFAGVDFSAARNRLRDADLYARPGVWLRAGFEIARLFERFHGKRLRARSTKAIVRGIKWELQTTSHTSISPVSGLLNILALWLHDPNGADMLRALQKLDGWIWEDDERGTRVAGARSASWDTGFALQALAALPRLDDGVDDALRRGADFLFSNQIGNSFEGFRDACRSDPKGGWCFAGGWHGWPVSDCTAEAVSGILAARCGAGHANELRDAVAFMLRSQNRDGGFGSYEARRSPFGLEWLNPAEMFGDSMTEHSFVECTASCLTALAACRDNFPLAANRSATSAISRGDAWLRRTQQGDGSWRGVWGVQFIYGTLFGVRGLLAAGAQPADPALRSACRWLLDRQRENGGWGEHHSGCPIGRYVPHDESQVIQTAWALIALLEARNSDWTAISRGARFLIDAQEGDGTWPKQDMAGVFFRTALLDYILYRQYFPLHALALYERRRRNRLDLTAADGRRRRP